MTTMSPILTLDGQPTEKPALPEDTEIEETDKIENEEAESEEEELTPEKNELEKYRYENQKLKKEKYRIAGEYQNLAREFQEQHLWKQQAAQQLAQSTEAAMVHYEKNLQLELSQAAKTKEKALEEGDIQAVLQADIDLARSAARVESLEKYYRERDVEAQQAQLQDYMMASQAYQQPYQQPYSAPSIPSEAEEWLQKNPWYIPGHPEFDQDKYEQVKAFSKILDKKLEREGRQNEYFSPAYFSEVENFVRQSYGTPSRELKMRPSNSAVSPVRHMGSGVGPQKERVVLSTIEKEMARNMGIQESDWIRHKRADQIKQKEKGYRHA